MTAGRATEASATRGETRRNLQATTGSNTTGGNGSRHSKPRPQSTEATIGPYSLHDFALFHTLRHGLRPSKIAFLAWHAWHDPDAGAWPPGFPTADRPAYTLAEIRHWLQVFATRFFGFSQFKRSALPNGPKVAAGGSLSPRGDWRAPSDLSPRIWLDDIDRNVPPS